MPPCWIPIICSQSTILVDPRKSKIIPNLSNTKRWPFQITITTGREPTGNGRKSFRNWMETQENKRKRPRSDWTVWKRTSVVEIEQNRLITGANVRSRTEPSGSVRWIELSGFFERHLIRFLNDFWDQYRRYSAKQNFERKQKYSRERCETRDTLTGDLNFIFIVSLSPFPISFSLITFSLTACSFVPIPVVRCASNFYCKEHIYIWRPNYREKIWIRSLLENHRNFWNRWAF